MDENKTIQDKELIIELHYEKGKDNPVKIFESCRLILESMINLQTQLIENINCSLKPDFVLTDVKSASIWASLTRKTIIIEEENLFNKNPIGDVNQYVDQSTTLITKRIADSKNSPIKNDDINILRKQINEIAQNNKVDQNIDYQCLPKEIIANICETAKQATDLLSENDSFDIVCNGETPITLSQINTAINKQNLLQEDDYKITESKISTTLTIRTANLIGNSKWEFITGDAKTIKAKIEDEDWLNIFHNNSTQSELSMSLSSGDALNIEGILKETHDKSGKLINTEYTITKVKGIVHNA